MRYAVLSDIHGNLEALAAVMERLASERIDRYLCLGDTIGYGADPAACLTRVQACEGAMIAGNHEAACIGKLDMGWFNEAARAALLWTRDQLGFAELDQVRRLPLTDTLECCTLVHATLPHPERFEYLVDLAQAVDTLAACRTLFCLAGHTHVPCVIEYDRTNGRMLQMVSAPEALGEVRVGNDPARRRYLVNPGSVGQPRDGDPRASVGIVDAGRAIISILRVPYDIGKAQRKILQAGLPTFLAERLAMGR